MSLMVYTFFSKSFTYIHWNMLVTFSIFNGCNLRTTVDMTCKLHDGYCMHFQLNSYRQYVKTATFVITVQVGY